MASCFEGFYNIRKIVPTKSNILSACSNNYPEGEIIIKSLPIFKFPPLLQNFNKELEITKRMGENRIGPILLIQRFCDEKYSQQQLDINADYGLFFMEKIDGTLWELWQYINIEMRNKVETLINEKIIAMHNLNITHQDTNPDNIMFKTTNNELTIYIIDYGMAQEISTLNTNEKYISWKKSNPTKSLDDFINWDFELWQLFTKDIPLPNELYFNFDFQIVSMLRTSRPFILALQKVFNWPILEILVEQNLTTIIIDYVLKAPGGEYYLNINGLISIIEYNKQLKDNRIYINEIKYNGCNQIILENLPIQINDIIATIKTVMKNRFPK